MKKNVQLFKKTEKKVLKALRVKLKTKKIH
jgi:hypothetical protein